MTIFGFVIAAVFNIIYSLEYDECGDISYGEYVVSL